MVPSVPVRRHNINPMLSGLSSNKANSLLLLFVQCSIYRPPQCSLAKFFRLPEGSRRENLNCETKGSFCRSWTVEVGLLYCRDAIFHLTRLGVIQCAAGWHNCTHVEMTWGERKVCITRQIPMSTFLKLQPFSNPKPKPKLFSHLKTTQKLEDVLINIWLLTII